MNLSVIESMNETWCSYTEYTGVYMYMYGVCIYIQINMCTGGT
jgi:hypothetical protein